MFNKNGHSYSQKNQSLKITHFKHHHHGHSTIQIMISTTFEHVNELSQSMKF